MPRTTSRRQFLKGSASLAIAAWLGPRFSLARGRAPSERLRIGCVGVANRARANIDGVRGEDIVALTDIDDSYLQAAAREFPDAELYHDFRKMMERRDIDAVVVSAPDHVHAPASVLAMKTGKHVYCEKPLSHSVYEARVMARVAAKEERATQMGIQIHNTGRNYRNVVEVIQTGAIGEVREAHCWVGKAWGGGERPAEVVPVPEHIHFDLWLGPAPERPYHPTYLPANWRRWWDFGSGTLGDMGCHYMDLPFWALSLRHPATVEAKGPPVHPETAPEWLEVHWRFPSRAGSKPVDLYWYDGGRRPPQFDEGKLPPWGDGVLFVGEGGMLLASYTDYRLLPEEKFRDYRPPAPFIPDSPGHYEEWIRSCRTGGKATCDFSYAGPLTETVLLGVVAYRSGKKLEWDPFELKAPNCPEAGRFLRRDYRPGWTL
ncbi:MAG: Gfo/Idh/MocA family protein [Planctomycetota bacterium]